MSSTQIKKEYIHVSAVSIGRIVLFNIDEY